MNLNLELYCYLQYKVKNLCVHKCKYFLVNAIEFPQCTNPISVVNKFCLHKILQAWATAKLLSHFPSLT